jgi:type II secretion system protein G
VYLLLALLLFSQDKGMDQLIEQLRSDSARDRTEAREELKRAGKAAIPALEKAGRDADPNLAQEARQLLEVIRAAPAIKAFARIEDTLRKAKTIRVSYKGEGDSAKGKSTSEGRVCLTRENRARVMSVTTSPYGALSPKIISDGVTLSMPLGEDDPDKRITPKNLSDLIAAALARIGVGDAFMNIRRASMGEPPGYVWTADDLWKVTDLTEGADEGAFKTLTYKVKPEDRDIPLSAKLWYDPVSDKIKKRTMTFDDGTTKWSSTERYEEVAFDAEIPEGTFTFTAEELAQMDMNVWGAKMFLSAIGEVLEKYRADTGAYPGTKEGLGALLECPPGTNGWKGPYLRGPELPKDHWGNAFSYQCPGSRNPKSFDLVSCGPDGKVGTKDDIFLSPRKPEDEKRK